MAEKTTLACLLCQALVGFELGIKCATKMLFKRPNVLAVPGQLYITSIIHIVCLNLSASDITVSSTLIRELMNKVDQLNKTVVELQENNTALADKSTALADKVNKIEGTILAHVSDSKLAFSNVVEFWGVMTSQT